LFVFGVTPLAGVWIEIQIAVTNSPVTPVVTPLAGVWIEINLRAIDTASFLVTPLAGVWIEISSRKQLRQLLRRHSPCGSVD